MTRNRPALIMALILVAAASRPAPGARYDDARFGFSLAVGEPWKEAAISAYTVPGAVRAAWSGPMEASVVAFVQEPGEAVSPRFLVDASAKAMREKLGCKIEAQEVKEVAGKKAMWMVASGKGTGGALTGQGDIDTTTQWVAVPREKDIIVVLLTCPAKEYEALRPSFEAAIKQLEVRGMQTAEQAAAR